MTNISFESMVSSKIVFAKVNDFESLIRDGRYVIDWEMINNLPLVKSLFETLNFDNNGEAQGLKYLQTLLNLDEAYDDSEIILLHSIYCKNEKEIKQRIADEANILDMSYEARVSYIVQKELGLYASELEPEDIRIEIAAITRHILRRSAEQIDDLSENNFIFHKKGWFRELENNVFLWTLFKHNIDGSDLERFYNDVDIDNLGDIMATYEKHFSGKLSSDDLEDLYNDNKGFFTTNFDLEESIKETHSVDISKQIFVMEAIAIAAEKYCDKQYAQDELKFYKEISTEMMQEKEQKREAERKRILEQREAELDTSNYPYLEDLSELQEKLKSLGMEFGDRIGNTKVTGFDGERFKTIMGRIICNNAINFPKFALYVINNFEQQHNRKKLEECFLEMRDAHSTLKYDTPYAILGSAYFLHTDSLIFHSLYEQFDKRLKENEENEKPKKIRKR